MPSRFPVRACAAAAASIVALASLAAAPLPQQPAAAWEALFDGKTLTNWKPTQFSPDGAVRVEDGRIILDTGRSMTGITWSGPSLPTTNYELTLQAMRVDGSDFFAGVTFPVDESFCSLILGGWGGSVVGLSSINSMDASENETSQSVEFQNGRWYTARIRVTPAKIEAWLDDRPIISQNLKDNRVSIRLEMELSKPLGISSWKTKSALRDIRLRRL